MPTCKSSLVSRVHTCRRLVVVATCLLVGVCEDSVLFFHSCCAGLMSPNRMATGIDV